MIMALGTPASSKHFLFLSLSAARSSNCKRLLGSLRSLRSLRTCILLRGDFGVGIRTMPSEAFWVHQAWINRRRVWLGVRSESLGRGWLDTGHVVFLLVNSHCSMLSRSYVMPVMAVTGSFMIWRDIGHMKYWGTSISSMWKKLETNNGVLVLWKMYARRKMQEFGVFIVKRVCVKGKLRGSKKNERVLNEW